MQERRDLPWPKQLTVLDRACCDILNRSKINAFTQKVTVNQLDSADDNHEDLARKCSTKMYVASLQELEGPVNRSKVLEDWRLSLGMLGDGSDFFQDFMVGCKDEYPHAGMTVFYVKNQEDVDWKSIAEALDLPPDMQWGHGQGDLSDNWLTYAEKISGITEPWLYIGPGFAGMHQEDGMMNSINISVPVSVLPMTDELLMDNDIDFLTATKVWQFSPASIDEEDLLAIRRCTGLDRTRTLNDRYEWRQLWGRSLILETDTRWAQSPGHAIITRGQVHSTLSSGGINLAWNRACGSRWPGRAREFDRRIYDAVGVDNDDLRLGEDDVPTNFPTDTIIHLAAMALVEHGPAGVHRDIVAGLQETWVPWVTKKIQLIGGETSREQAALVDLAVRCSRCWRQTIYSYTRIGDLELCWSCKDRFRGDSGTLVHNFPLVTMREWLDKVQKCT